MSFPRFSRLVLHRAACCKSILPPAYNFRKFNYSPPITSYNHLTSVRKFCSTEMDRVVTYEDVVTYKDRPEVLLIDVREPDELKQTGIIPSSINIPMGDLASSLQIQDDDQFKKKYHRALPSKDMEVVFTCKMGGRAKKAMDTAIQLGFTNSKVYKGSYDDWAIKNQ